MLSGKKWKSTVQTRPKKKEKKFVQLTGGQSDQNGRLISIGDFVDSTSNDVKDDGEQHENDGDSRSNYTHTHTHIRTDGRKVTKNTSFAYLTRGSNGNSRQ